MAVFLLLIKIVLWAIVTIVGTITFALLIFLFFPFKYKLNVRKAEKISAGLVVSWIFGLFSLKYYKNFENKVDSFKIKVLFWTIVGNTNKKKRVKDKKKFSVKKLDENKKVDEQEENKLEINVKIEQENLEIDNVEIIVNEEKVKEHKYETIEEAEFAKKIEDEIRESLKVDNTKTVDDLKNEDNEDVDNEKEFSSFNFKINSLLEKASGIFEKINFVLNYENKEEIILHTKKMVVKTITNIIPKKFSVKCEMGFDDPSTTGIFIGLIYCFKSYFFIDDRLEVLPNFFEDKIEVDCKIDDYVSVWDIGYPFLIYIFKKPIWKIINKYLLKKKTVK